MGTAEKLSGGNRRMASAMKRYPESATAEAMCGLNTAPRLSRIAAPTLVISTPEDPGAPREVEEKMARLIPNADLVWLTPARHLSSLKHPERFNTLVAAFVSRQR